MAEHMQAQDALDLDEGILAELSILEQLLEGGPVSGAREELMATDWLREALEDAQPRERYRPLGPTLAKVAAVGVATFPAVLTAAPSFANEALPYNMMIAMAERPPAAPMAPAMGNTGLHLFPFSRPMMEMRSHVAASAQVSKVNLPLNPKLAAIFREQRKVTVTSKHKAAVTFYAVAPGDSLYTIAADMLGSGARWREIYAANQNKITRGYLVHPGQKLVIPTPRKIKEAPATAVAKTLPLAHPATVVAAHAGPAAQPVAHVAARPAAAQTALGAANAGRYHVAPGDSLYVIAARHLHNPMRWKEILTLNKTVLQGKTLIYPNQWLVLPSET